jgi:hypothetical protein
VWGRLRAVPVELMSSSMRPIRAAAEAVVASGRLEPPLGALVTAGVRAYNGGVYFKTNLREHPNLIRGNLGRTCHEALVNKLHLDDLLGTGGRDWPARCVGHGVLLGRRVIADAAMVTGTPIEVVISVDPGDETCAPSATFRFYGRRDDPWLTEDLDAYGEPVLVLRTSRP